MWIPAPLLNLETDAALHRGLVWPMAPGTSPSRRTGRALRFSLILDRTACCVFCHKENPVFDKGRVRGGGRANLALELTK